MSSRWSWIAGDGYKRQAFYRTEPYEGIDYLTEIEKIHEIVVGQGLSRDVVSDDNPIEGYKLLITPFLPHVKDHCLLYTSPYVVCHMLASLDGRIDGEFFSAPETTPALNAYGKLRNYYGEVYKRQGVFCWWDTGRAEQPAEYGKGRIHVGSRRIIYRRYKDTGRD